MCFSPSPPPPIPKAILSSNLTSGYECRSGHLRIDNCEYRCEDYNRNKSTVVNKEPDNMQRQEDMKNLNESRTDEETSSDYKQWLHAMKLVARLPGGIPPEFRRKLWLSLADKYLKSKNIDWTKEEEKCFCEKWREDDEELGIQIVKDLHRTGSTLCTGPAADLNQAKLKKILLGYARYNPEVGYCQGFNMLGALILQVMDKNESEAIKVMIYLVEGILPTGYFCGSMGGLQADMAVFRELMQTKLPRLAKHLQKLQGPIENAFEPPLTNVFTMQWFLTMFCTCLPMSCVLRVWDLVLIEGSDVLLRTALALWSLLEERVLSARSADDFYGKMGSFSSELLNGHLIDSNGLIEKVVQLGPIADIQKLRDKHLYNIAPIERQQGLQLYYDDDEPGMDEDSRLAVATVWGIPWGRRGSQGQPNNVSKQAIESKDRIALDISLLKKQYDRLRERQKQAHIILTTACSAASRQSTSSSTSTAPLPVNQLLSGRPAIVTNKGRRSGPPSGAVPPARKPSLPAVLQDKPLEKQLRRGETLYWRDAKDTKSRRDSLSWKEIKAERTALISSGSIDGLKSQKIRSGRLGKSDSSSYSEESDDNEVEEVENASSTDTSLCDEEMQSMTNGIKQQLLIESSKKTGKTIYKSKRNVTKQRNQTISLKEIGGKARPKSWAPSNTEIPFVLMTTDSPNNSADENPEPINIETKCITENNMLKEEKALIAEETQTNFNETDTLKWKSQTFQATSDVLVIAKIQCSTDKDSQKSLINDVEPILSIVNQEPSFDNLKSTSTEETISTLSKTTRLGCNGDKEDNIKTFDVSDEGVTNEYFERINNSERPKKLNLLYSLNEDENIRDAFKIQVDSFVKSNKESLYCADDKSLNTSKNIRCMDLLVDYSEKSSAACIEEAKTEITTTLQSVDSSVPISTKKEYTGNSNEILLKKSKSSAEKRRDPRRLTLTRSSTMDIEKRYQALEKRLSMEVCTKYKRLFDENEFHLDSEKHSIQNYSMNPKNKIEVFSKEDYVVVDKNIPSTADLEERFENMQQQLVRDRKKIKSPCDSENTEKTDLNNFSENNISRNPSSNDKKVNSPKKQDDHTESNEKIESEKISNAKHHFEEKPLNSSKTDSIEATSKAENRETTVEGSLKRTTSETNVLQNKKEPPDDDDVIIEKDSKTTVDPSTTAEKSIATSSQAAEENSKEIIKNSKPVEKNETIEEYQESSKKTADRASPPSTEELEKRFCALEEQMSSIMKESDETFNSSMAISEKMEERGATVLKLKNQDSNKTAFDSRKSVPDATNISAPADSDTSSSKIKPLSEINTKRRLSEPPTTEDLEKRYEIFKRRMSSRNFEPRTFHKNIPTLEPQQDQKTNQINSPTKLIEEDTNKHSPPSIENLEERFEKLQNKNDSKKIITTHSPPSTENLEKRFENLQSKSDQFETPKSNNDPKTKNSPAENVQPTSNGNNTKANSNATFDKDEVKIVDNKDKEFTASISENAREEDVSPKKKPVNVLSRNSNKIKIKLIEELQAKIKESSKNTDINKSVENKKAVVKELEMKMNSSPEKLLKPTQITTRRRAPAQSSLLPSHSFNDETLESHATSAYRRSGKYEPANSANRKMVRRFSDTPSRADLENRLQFLEEQLSKTVCMQRRSSDSEVASNSHIKHKASMTHAKPLSNSLEYRVQELEKRVNDNRTISMGVECTSVNGKTPDPEIEVSQVDLASDAVAVTGKELVRYSSYGEAGDNEHQNPINISINIQMTLNKDGAGTKKSIDVSKTDDLDRRLQFLEQRLKTTQVHDTVTCQNATDDVNECVNRQDQEKKSDDAEENDDQRLQKTISKNTENVCQAVKQDIENLTASETCNLPKSAENIENKTEIMEAKPNETDSLAEKPKDNVDKPCQAEKINHQAENTNAIEEKTSGELKNNTNSLKQSSLSKEDKQIENSTSEDQNKENEIINLTEQHQSSKKNSTTEMKQKNVKEAENDINSLQQNIKIPDDDNKTSVDLKEPSSSTINRSTESKLNEKSNTDAKGNPEIENVSSSTDPTQFVPVEVNKKTLVLLLGNEPKAVKVRRLTRANTEELEDLFQALEKQLNNREQVKITEKTLKAESHKTHQNEIEASKAMSDLAKEIEAFSKSETDISEETKSKQKKQEEEFDWGIDPIKYHLKKKTVYLPSTKELEARFRSLERQIKLLEDVEKIDVEHRLIEIDRKIKLQYSLSHEKDLNKFLELCEGKDPDEMKISLDKHQDRTECCDQKCTARHTSPHRLAEPIPSNSSLEYRYRSLDSKRSKSKQNLKKQPIHPLEMLLDPSPDDSAIPTTGELEHRIRVMEETRITPSPPLRKSRSQSPPVKCQHNKTKPNTHILETMTASPTERELPTAEELEARLEALEREQCFNFKMQKNFQQFNQKLKDVVSPSLSSDDIKSSEKHCDSGHTKIHAFSAAKQNKSINALGPKSIRFREEDNSESLTQNEIMLKKDILDSKCSTKGFQQNPTVQEGLGVMGIRLMRETSPLRRKGTHTGVPLRTGENINDQLTSIQNSIKSIDSLCEEKPYRNERCQQYIDALFSDSTYFAHKKSSLEDLASRNLSRSTSREIGPSIRISDHSPAFSRSMGSADSIKSSSPLRSTSPLQYRSNRDLRRELSPRRRRDEDREEHESRVRRDYLLSNNINCSHSLLSHTSHSSLTKFHKVDSQLIPNDVEHELEESLRHPKFSTIDNLINIENTNTSNNVNTTLQRTLNAEVMTPDSLKSHPLDWPTSPFRQTIPLLSSHTPVYTPAKLEIRHTTVTSTFYDRVLAEKQLEKQHHSVPTNNQPSIISPILERHIKPTYQQQTTKSPTKPLNTDLNDTLTFTDASTGNYQHTFQSHIQAKNHC